MKRFFNLVDSWFRLRDPLILDFKKIPHDKSFWRRNDLYGPVLVYATIEKVSKPVGDGSITDAQAIAVDCIRLHVDVPILYGRITYRFSIACHDENDASFSLTGSLAEKRNVYHSAIGVRDMIQNLNPHLPVVMIWDNGKFPNKPPAWSRGLRFLLCFTVFVYTAHRYGT